MKTNFHTHSCFCDGKGEPQEYVEYAIAHAFTHLGFSSHAPVPFKNDFAIKAEHYRDYCDTVRFLKEKYAERIAIYLGLEIDYIPRILDDFQPLIGEGRLDYCIGGVHLVNNPDDDPANIWFIDGPKQETYDEGLQRVFHGDVRRGVTAFFYQTNLMIERTRPNVVAHFDKIDMHNRGRFFSTDEQWYKELLFETIDHIHSAGIIAEVNTRGLYKKRHADFYPSQTALQRMKELRIPVLVGTDAHEPANLDMYEGAFEMLESMHYPEIVYTPF